MERAAQVEVIKNIRKVFLVASKAFDVADILGKPDQRRDQMRALHNEAISATDNLDSVEDLDPLTRHLESLLLRMEQLASVNKATTGSFASGGIMASNSGEQIIPERLKSRMTTKDEQPGREPLLSDDGILSMDRAHRSDYEAGEPSSFEDGAQEARAWYENKITKGELMVVRTVRVSDLEDPSFNEISGAFRYCSCGAMLTEPFNFCPGCGAKIAE